VSRKHQNPFGWVRVAGAIVSRPGLWRTAVRQSRRMARRNWWSRAPFLPLPGPGYLSFRMETQYGDGAHRPDPQDVIHYLSWCRQMERLGVLPQ
jgi:hypothetical protein